MVQQIINMNKKEYTITRESDWFKVEVFDEN